MCKYRTESPGGHFWDKDNGPPVDKGVKKERSDRLQAK